MTYLEILDCLEILKERYNEPVDKLVEKLFNGLSLYAHKKGIKTPFTANTPYINTIPHSEEKPYPGNLNIEEHIQNVIRWNAMAMVVRANREEKGIGGHISTYASAATLYEVGFNHFFRANTENDSGDLLYFQGHSSPGIYARAFLEGRIPLEQVDNFRHELHEKPGLSSYPHPWLMPEFWKFPTVSMGLGSISAIYHARFIKYLEDRGLKKGSDRKIWAFIGDGETDEPETLGAISLATREQLDNLIFVVNCNLQRLDGPVRGNGKIIQELEADFRGTGWNVIKVIWGSDWDPLLEKDDNALLLKRMEEAVDGEYQKYVVEDGAYFRENFFGKYPELLKMVEDYSDEQLKTLCMARGGHDPLKVYTAYKSAVEHHGGPTVILAKTIKGHGLGEGGEGMNITHQQKLLNEKQLRVFRTRFSIPLSDTEIKEVPFYKMQDNSPETVYLQERRKSLGGYNPVRLPMRNKFSPVEDEFLGEFFEGTGDREASTTMAFVKLLSRILSHPEIGKYVVPIVPDEARTFGMDSLFTQYGIYSHPGQLYKPVDVKNLLYYREVTDGQIIEEGITESGSMASFIAAGTAYSNHGLNMIPFFTFYSMFGLQRAGDMIWAAGDSRAKGFLMGATSGRTTLAGEGLQHQDGNSHMLAYTLPNMMAYDPAYAYELTVIIQEGLRRMYHVGEDIFYYITIMNENYIQPRMPKNSRKGILKGIYRLNSAGNRKKQPLVQLFGSGAILNQVLRAQTILEEEYDIASEAWSVTSYKELYRDALDAERNNMIRQTKKTRKPYITSCLEKHKGPVIAATDYLKALPLTIAEWVPSRMIALGTDGFGRSDGRESLRDFFEVDARHIALAALYSLEIEGHVDKKKVKRAIKNMEINTEKIDPVLL